MTTIQRTFSFSKSPIAPTTFQRNCGFLLWQMKIMVALDNLSAERLYPRLSHPKPEPTSLDFIHKISYLNQSSRAGPVSYCIIRHCVNLPTRHESCGMFIVQAVSSPTRTNTPSLLVVIFHPSPRRQPSPPSA